MSEENVKTSPFWRYQNEDLEAGSSSKSIDNDDDCGSPFDIPSTKSAPNDRLKRWRQAALVLNANRRFRYTSDLKNEEERKQLIAKIRTHAQVMRAAVLFQEQESGEKVNDRQDLERKAKISKEHEIKEVPSSEEEKTEDFDTYTSFLRQNRMKIESPFHRATSSLLQLDRQELERKAKVSKENEIKEVLSSSEAKTEEFDTHASFLKHNGMKIETPFHRAMFMLETWIFVVSLNSIFQRHRRTLTEVPKENSTGTWSEQSLAMLISVMGIFAGGAYLAPLAFRDVFQLLDAKQFKTVNLSILELFTFPSAAIENFLFFTAVTITFILSMVVIATAVCFIFRKWAWGTSLTILSLFTIVVFVLSFFAMLSKIVPHSITIAGGYLKIPAVLVVIFYDIYVIFIVYALAYIAKGLWSFWHKQDAGVIRNIPV